MPELPEVETVRRGLALKLEGRVLARVDQYRPDLRFPLPPDFAASLTGRRILSLDRRAKYILARLEGGLVWLIHLGMSGRMLVQPGPAGAPGTHDHLVFHTDDGCVVTYNDARRFGAMDLFPETALETHPMLAGLGPEPLGNGFSEAVLSARLAGRRTPIKAALLDQRIVAGLGNIYVCEALFRAGIAPDRLAATVAGADAARLVPVIRDVLTEAIAAGGSTLRDFVQSDGELGYFQHNFRVYGREDEPCQTCGHDGDPAGLIRRITQAGRSTFYCGRCQR
ncbi:bifunctional DNA-formamidopyrimidine glycosylase/DNA-(apurinic or apyrimidinic site) lyase [Niveispirillum irakense]|uniref:bifunctional DNA-formamidopyrimidine glycosylase/DNA-(apurinic or apyrimidinic site) lyase n=1 Tax=Niveispirillum irakense TaxID=34011 RepID=UPI0004074792|nr:bifunctional DNA-formamidopyrimidine glycosylase/DNA-(apurinic or apyrimidinic site) lyase [Niveispirillum irakense]